MPYAEHIPYPERLGSVSSAHIWRNYGFDSRMPGALTIQTIEH